MTFAVTRPDVFGSDSRMIAVYLSGRLMVQVCPVSGIMSVSAAGSISASVSAASRFRQSSAQFSRKNGLSKVRGTRDARVLIAGATSRYWLTQSLGPPVHCTEECPPVPSSPGQGPIGFVRPSATELLDRGQFGYETKCDAATTQTHNHSSEVQ